MKIESRILFPTWFLLLATSSTALRGQTASPQLAVEFTCVTWENLPFGEIFYRDGEEGMPVTIGRGVRSDPHTIKGESDLQLHIKHVDAEGNKVFKLVGKAPFQPGANRMLFMIESNQEASGLPLKIFGMDDSLQSFPVGAFRFLNLTRGSVQVDFNGARKGVTPGQFSTIDAKAPDLGGFLPFFVRDIRGKTVFETRLFAQPRGVKSPFCFPRKKRAADSG